MHEINIETLREEAKRLIAKEIALLNKVKNSPNVLTEAGNGKQSLDVTSLPKELEKLEEEISKLDSLELVLAVVGTMKAGKSTTINAIVGMEVLPNRNRPMTALPTLIRHTLGATTPKLIFGNVAPVNALLKALGKEIYDNPKPVGDLEREPSMRQLLARIRKGESFQDVYEGSDGIFSFLTELNDLVRLSSELGLAFPFDSYSRIENLPVIEVEFTHLREMGEMQGRLTLLDTPGPNEAGQSHLRKMLRDQLKKASAVLAVLDYTQLKSDADDEMRENLSEVAKVTGDRLYALVNKFDQKDRNSDSAEQVRQYVARTLMRGGISGDRVFPVSSRLGYLASQAKNEMLLNGHLPDPKDHAWVEDFAKEEFGRRWQEKLQDQRAVKDAAEFLWKESLFDEPLKKVIRQAYGKAAVLAIESSASKMVDVAENTQNFLGTRKQALKRSVGEIQQQMSRLQQDIESIQEQEAQVAVSVKKSLDKVKEGIRDLRDKVHKTVTDALEGYFKEGKAVEEKESTRLEDKRGGKEGGGGWSNDGASPVLFWGGIFGKYRAWEDNDKRDFDPNNPIITIKDKREAERLITKISQFIDRIFTQVEPALQKGISRKLDEFDASFRASVNRAEELIKGIKEGMQGFDLIIHMPNVRKVQLDTSVSDLMADAITETTESETRRRRKSGIWGKVCGFFNTDDWGYESYSVNVDVYRIDVEKIRSDVVSGFKKMFQQLEESGVEEIKVELEGLTDAFFSALREKVERIRGDLLAGLHDREKSETMQKALVVALTELAKPVPALLKDSKELSEQVSELRSAAGETV